MLKAQFQKLLDENANKTRQLKKMNEAIQQFQSKLNNNNDSIRETINEMKQQQNEIILQQKSSNATIQIELTEIKQSEKTLSGRLENATDRLNSDIQYIWFLLHQLNLALPEDSIQLYTLQHFQSALRNSTPVQAHN